MAKREVKHSSAAPASEFWGILVERLQNSGCAEAKRPVPVVLRRCWARQPHPAPTQPLFASFAPKALQEDEEGIPPYPDHPCRAFCFFCKGTKTMLGYCATSQSTSFWPSPSFSGAPFFFFWLTLDSAVTCVSVWRNEEEVLGERRQIGRYSQ